jgi:hypothetical protein
MGNNEDVTERSIEIARRPALWRDRLRAYKVILDGSEVGKIRDGQAIDLRVSPGKHDLRLKIDWSGSQGLTFEASASEIIRFECEPSGTALTAAFGVISSFRKSGTPWVSLRRVAATPSDG